MDIKHYEYSSFNVLDSYITTLYLDTNDIKLDK